MPSKTSPKVGQIQYVQYVIEMLKLYFFVLSQLQRFLFETSYSLSLMAEVAPRSRPYMD